MIDKVLSSEWCRCKQTAEYGFDNNYETKSFLKLLVEDNKRFLRLNFTLNPNEKHVLF